MIDIKVEKIKKKINSRNKGKSAEREVRDIIQGIVDYVFKEKGVVAPVVKRNLMQSMEGGHDLVGTPGIAVEVKRCETLQLDKWWIQAVNQGLRIKAIPVLFYRKSHAQWRIRMVGSLNAGKTQTPALVDIDTATFLEWYTEYLGYYLDTAFLSRKD